MKKLCALSVFLFLSLFAFAEKYPWLVCSANFDTPSEPMDRYQFYGYWYDGDVWSMGWLDYYSDFSCSDEAPAVSFNNPFQGSVRSRIMLVRKVDPVTGKRTFYVGEYSAITLTHDFICLEFDSADEAVDTLLLWCYLRTICDKNHNDLHFIPWSSEVWYDENNYEYVHIPTDLLADDYNRFTNESFPITVIHNSRLAYETIKNSSGYYYCNRCSGIFYGLEPIELYGFHSSAGITSPDCFDGKVACMVKSINTRNFTHATYR